MRQPNPEHERILQGFRPSYYTAVGLRTAVLDKIDVWDGNGRTYAYYSVTYFNPDARSKQRLAWRYKVQDGRPVEDKAFPVTAR